MKNKFNYLAFPFVVHIKLWKRLTSNVSQGSEKSFEWFTSSTLAGFVTAMFFRCKYLYSSC